MFLLAAHVFFTFFKVLLIDMLATADNVSVLQQKNQSAVAKGNRVLLINIHLTTIAGVCLCLVLSFFAVNLFNFICSSSDVHTHPPRE
jgi:hypothetical protein